MKIEFDDETWVYGTVFALIAIMAFVLMSSVMLKGCEYDHVERMKKLQIEEKTK